MKVQLAVVIVLTTLVSARAQAVEPGAAEGRMMVNGKAIALRHAYAATEASARGDAYVRVVLSDQALSAEQLAAFPDSVLTEIKAGKLHALRFLIVDGEGTLDATDVFDAGGMPTIKEASTLTIESVSGTAIAGRLHLAGVQKFPDWNMTLEYDLRFAAPMAAAD
jgi:hypothetical protein